MKDSMTKEEAIDYLSKKGILTIQEDGILKAWHRQFGEYSEWYSWVPYQIAVDHQLMLDGEYVRRQILNKRMSLYEKIEEQLNENIIGDIVWNHTTIHPISNVKVYGEAIKNELLKLIKNVIDDFDK